MMPMRTPVAVGVVVLEKACELSANARSTTWFVREPEYAAVLVPAVEPGTMKALVPLPVMSVMPASEPDHKQVMT